MFEIDENNRTLDFIYNDEITEKNPIKDQSFIKTLKMHISVPPYYIFSRILASLIPPILTKKYQKIYVDLLGPTLAILILTGLLHYGYSNKMAALKITPSETVLAYATIMPILCYILNRLAQSGISFIEMASVLGYSLYGHIFALAVSLFFQDDTNNVAFFICLMVFGGLSTLRVAMILIATISKPALRLVICSFVATIQLLFLVFLHFGYMHRTFVYGRG